MIKHLASRLLAPLADAFQRLRQRHLRLAVNLYPPYLGAGVRVVEWSDDHRRVVVEMRHAWWNWNYMGTHFGGSLYAMCDPFYALMVIRRLGSGYVVWDRAATIHFLRPGRGTVRATFVLEDAALEAIRAEVTARGRTEATFGVDVLDAAGKTVAQVEKVIFVRRAAP